MGGATSSHDVCGRPWPELFQAGAGVVWQSQEAQGSQVVMGMVTSQVGTGWHALAPAPPDIT